MELACVAEKTKGPAAYGACLDRQITSLRDSRGIPSLGNYDDEARRTMEYACVTARMKGPVAYGECLRDQIESISAQPSLR